MPTTFNVISLGNLADIDTVEGNTTAENASALVGLSFGDADNPLVDQIQQFAPGSPAFNSDRNSYYDMNDSTPEAFTIDGGANQFFDGTSVYNATITYGNGTTATITAVIFQDTNGNTYLAPEFSANADQAALEADVIQSISLDSLAGNVFSGMTGSRESFDFVACFTRGTKIHVVDSHAPIEFLQAGDLVYTQDGRRVPIRWIGTRKCSAEDLEANPKLYPVRITAGSLGRGLPKRDMLVSRQHRMLVSSRVAGRMFGTEDVLIPAIKLTALPGIHIDRSVTEVEYFHILLDHHEVITAEGAPTESLLTGPEALKTINPDHLEELLTLFPELRETLLNGVSAKPIPTGPRQKRLMARHLKNGKPPLEQGRDL